MTLAKHLAVGGCYGKRGRWHLPHPKVRGQHPAGMCDLGSPRQNLQFDIFPAVTFVTALSRRHRLRSCGLREAPSGHFATGAAEGPSERRRKPMKSPIARSSDNLLTVLELDG